MSEGFTNPANTNLGNTIYAELSLGDTQDQLADAQRVSGNSISSLEKELAEAASLDNNPEVVSKWAKGCSATTWFTKLRQYMVYTFASRFPIASF